MNEIEYHSNEELQKQYSPSAWCRRWPPDQVVDEHLRITRQASVNAKPHLLCQTNVLYGPTAGQRMDIFRNENTSPGSPVFVFFHGGYWQALSKNDYGYVALPIVQAGGVAIIVDYDLAPHVTVSEIILQTRKATEDILRLAEKSKSRGVYLCGHSAGAHLAVMSLAVNTATAAPISEDLQKIIKGFILLSGIYDLRPLVQTYINDELHLTAEEAWSASSSNPEILSKLSELYQHCHVTLAVGEYESPEFKKQSLHYQSLLENSNMSTKLIMVPAVDHFDIVENLQDSSYTLTKEIIALMGLDHLKNK